LPRQPDLTYLPRLRGLFEDQLLIIGNSTPNFLFVPHK